MIAQIRRDIGHNDVEVDIMETLFDEPSGTLLIITPDRPEKSVVIGKGGWVVGRLREELGVNSIHVEAYSDFIVPQYRMELARAKLEKITQEYPHPYNKPLLNLIKLLKARIENPYSIESLLRSYPSSQSKIQDTPVKGSGQDKKRPQFQSVVALSGGVDSSTSLIIAQMLGFHPLAVTVNPGDIILPRYFRDYVESLTQNLGVEHRYLEVDMQEVISGALEGRFHPCGRCSKIIEKEVLDFAGDNHIPFLIYGDLLSTGAQSLQWEEVGAEDNLMMGKILRINLPALLSLKKR
nr:7-cyano-7-deazaguanine synthase [Methanobacterium formicicum]